MLIGKYLVSFRQAIERLDDYGFAESIIYKEERRAGKQVIVNAEIVLVDGHLIFLTCK